MRYNAIIIGAGLGGLTAGAKLSKEGKKVLLIEQHSIPGGCATTFRRGDFTLEVGLHEMDGPGQRDMKSRIFSDLAVSSNVEFVPIPEFYRFMNDRISVTVPHDHQKAIALLSDLFPQEVDGIRKYFDLLLAPRKKGNGPPDPDTSIGLFLDSVINNDDLKLILLGNLGYFHDDPYSLSLAYYSVAQGSYYLGGASYIKGGSQKLSDHLSEFIKINGGEVLFNHLVTGITVAGNKAESVIYRKKGSQETKEAFGDEIIAGCAVPNLPGLLGGDAGDCIKSEYSGLKNGASLLTLYLGFSNPPSSFGNKHYSTSVFDSSVKRQSDIKPNNNDDYSKRSFIFVDYSQIDSSLALGGKSVGAVCCVDYLENWQGMNREEYNRKKEEVARKLIDRLEIAFPGIKGSIEYYEVGTPATIERYTLNPNGAVYGFAQTPSRFSFDRFDRLDNLHVASAWGKTGGGFSGAIYGGYLCAMGILRKRN